jgi:hypothetical protein
MEVLSQICLEGLRKTAQNLRIASAPPETHITSKPTCSRVDLFTSIIFYRHIALTEETGVLGGNLRQGQVT